MGKNYISGFKKDFLNLLFLILDYSNLWYHNLAASLTYVVFSGPKMNLHESLLSLST